MVSKQLLQTWRWFGPNDPVSLSDVRQTGTQGVVTALHHIPHGEVWPVDEIKKRQAELATHGLKWSVVESLSIHEDIKTRSGDVAKWINNYKVSLRNLAACGLEVVTYNFMPVNDWTRTDIAFQVDDGSLALNFDLVDFAMFDIHLLERIGAKEDFAEHIVNRAAARFSTATQTQKDTLVDTVLFGIPGEERRTLDTMRRALEPYNDIDRVALKSNYAHFLQEVSPVAEEVGIRLAVHPDDPAFDILGLPRIVSTVEDLRDIASFAPSPANGFCICCGSLCSNPKNDIPAILTEMGSRVHFAHFRNIKKDGQGNFHESDHLDGDVDMYAAMKALYDTAQQVDHFIPFRPDHGHQMMDDIGKVTNPGYSCIGRMRGLAELRGLHLGIARSS
ncbi:MAG TPA: mannonate dehydratase [Pyrinomonadaceae bacterium]|nr:mannonate dehydratase [Pyrinomonadaceae bacterium]